MVLFKLDELFCKSGRIASILSLRLQDRYLLDVRVRSKVVGYCALQVSRYRNAAFDR
jgi:hypothetical protein